jgi:membrane protein
MDIARHIPARLRAAYRIGGAMAERMGHINIGLISAGVAFYGLLAVFPSMTAVVALWGLFADPAVVAEEVAALEPMVPEEGFDILQGQVESLASGESTTLGWASAVSLLAALWASRSGVAAIIGGLNQVHECRSRGGILHAIVALALSATMILAALVALASVVIAPVALALLPLGPFTGLALDVLRWVLGIGIVLFAIGVLYRFGPRERAVRPVWRRAGVISPGTIMAVGLWGVVSLGFSTYLSNFGNYDRVYGSLGAVIALLMWLYLSGFTVLLGAVFDVELARSRQGGPAPAKTGADTDEDGGYRRAGGNAEFEAEAEAATGESAGEGAARTDAASGGQAGDATPDEDPGARRPA